MLKNAHHARPQAELAPSQKDRRALLGWMSAGAMVAALPVLASCGGSGDDAAAGTPAPDAGTPALDPGVRIAVLRAVESKFVDLADPAITPIQHLHALADYMASRPEYTSTGVDEDTRCAWGIFTDGRVHIVTNNYVPNKSAPAAAAAAARTAKPLAASRVELPSARLAHAMHSFGPNYPEAQSLIADVREKLTSNGYAVSGLSNGDASLPILRGLGAGDGFFLMFTHGGSARFLSEKGTMRIYSIQSSSLVVEEDERTSAVVEDFAHLRLTYFSAPNGNQKLNWKLQLVDESDTRYGISAEFVLRYWQFAPGSLVFIDACHSADTTDGVADPFIAAFHKKGAEAYIGWTETMSNVVAFKAPRYFVDRVIGANATDPGPEDPKQRAFAWDEVLEDMAQKQLDIDPETKARLVGKAANPGQAVALAPGLHHLEVDEYNQRLTLVGTFGTRSGDVRVGGVPVDVLSWAQDKIVCVLPPPTASGSRGDVFVRVNERKSNVRQLTMWTLNLNCQWVDAGRPGLRVQGTAVLRFRADVGPSRDKPAQGVKFPTRYAVATADSVLPLKAGGTYSDGACTDSWSGSVDLPAMVASPTANSIMASLKIETNAQTLVHTGTIGLAVAGVTPPFTESSTCGPANKFAVGFILPDQDSFARQAGGNTVMIKLPAMKIALRPNYTIVGGSQTVDDMTLTWSDVPADSPPQDKPVV